VPVAREQVIDLGLLEPVPEHVRPPRPGLRRRAALAMVGLLVIAFVAGSAPPLDLPVSVPMPATGRFEVVGDLLFIAAGHSQPPDGEPERGRRQLDWTAYDLSAGEPLWTLRGMGDRLSLVAVDGLLWDDGFPLDPATGQWLSPEGSSVPDGYRYLGVPGGRTLVINGGYRPYSDNAVDLEFTYEVAGVDAETGSVRWRDEPDPGVRVWLAGDPVQVVTISSDELVSVRAPDTGEVLASRRIPGATSVDLIGDELLVRVWEAGGEVIRAYARKTMARLWELPRPHGSLERCGRMLCVHTAPEATRTVIDAMSGDGWQAPLTTELIDPATGEQAWVTAHRLYPVGERFLTYDDTGALRAILDARSGRVLRDLTGWQAVVRPVGHGYGVLPERAGLAAVTLLRTGAAGDTLAARLDVATGGLTELGVLPARPARCQPYPAGVVCSYADRVWVWPL
jgi:hypothetical protein